MAQIAKSELRLALLHKLATVLNPDGDARLATVRASSLHLGHHIGTVLDDLAEDDMGAIKVRRRHEGQKELTAIRVGASVGHREIAFAYVAVLEVFIRELSAINALTAPTTSVGEVTSLGHEARDDPVEGGALEVKRLARPTHALLASAECTEVLRCLRCVTVKVHNDATTVALSDTHVEEDFSVSLSCWH